MRLLNWILAGCFFTASCDVILVVNLGGSVRLAQFLLGLVCIAALAKVIQDGRILWPRGGASITLWLLSQFLFLPLSGVISIGVQFFALLAFTIFGVFAFVQLYGKSESIEALMRLYLLSYVFVGLFGLLQFSLPALGGPSLLIQQWIIHGKVPRINGFNYEPSFFATYLLMGWIMLVDLRLSGARITQGRVWKWFTIALTAALILSSSKTAWVFVLLELLTRSSIVLWRAGRGAVHQIAAGRLVLRLPSRQAKLSIVTVVAVVLLGGHFFASFLTPKQLLNGTGLGGTAAHSVDNRSAAAASTYAAFREHPFIGRSLGGVPIYNASRMGLEVHSMGEVRNYWGFPVLFDVMVASGLIAVIPFLLFFYVNTIGALRTARRYWPTERAKWLRALARAMIFECLVLLTDQNLLRVYLWFHVSMVALVAYNVEFGSSTALPEAEVIQPGGPMLEPLPSL